MIGGQHGGQAAGRRALHRGDAQPALRLGRQHRLAGFLGQVQHAPGVVEQGLAGRSQHHALAVTQEQLDAERGLQLADAGGDIGLHAVQAGGGAGDAAFLHHGAEDFQGSQVHCGPLAGCDDEVTANGWRSDDEQTIISGKDD